MTPPTGRCAAGATPCGAPARLYLQGWRCPTHKPEPKPLTEQQQARGVRHAAIHECGCCPAEQRRAA
jgi:hypothetical protein